MLGSESIFFKKISILFFNGNTEEVLAVILSTYFPRFGRKFAKLGHFWSKKYDFPQIGRNRSDFFFESKKIKKLFFVFTIAKSIDYEIFGPKLSFPPEIWVRKHFTRPFRGFLPPPPLSYGHI